MWTAKAAGGGVHEGVLHLASYSSNPRLSVVLVPVAWTLLPFPTKLLGLRNRGSENTWANSRSLAYASSPGAVQSLGRFRLRSSTARLGSQPQMKRGTS